MSSEGGEFREAKPYVGTWEIIKCEQCTELEEQTVKGVRFRLEENGDVTWTVLTKKRVLPLFKCESYDIEPIYLYNCFNKTPSDYARLRFGAYSGHILDFKFKMDGLSNYLLLINQEWWNLYCKRVEDEETEGNFQNSFSLLPALEEGYFSNLILTSSNKKEFKVHSTILKLQTGDLDWGDNCPFRDLSEDVLRIVLHYLYAECLPEDLTETLALKVIKVATPFGCFANLIANCHEFIQKTQLKQQIILLVNEMHDSIAQIVEHLNLKSDETSAINSEKLCYSIKQAIREAAVAGVKFVHFCVLFSSRKVDLSRNERHEVVEYAKLHFLVFITQFGQVLQTLKNSFGAMPASHRFELATFLASEVEAILDTVLDLITEAEKALRLIMLESDDECRSANDSIKNTLRLREIKYMTGFHDIVLGVLRLIQHKKKSFKEMSSSEKVRAIARNLEELTLELPHFLRSFKDVSPAFDEFLPFSDFQFWFTVGTSKVATVMDKLSNHRELIQEILQQSIDLTQRDAFTQTLHNLNLIDASHSEPDKHSPAAPQFHDFSLTKALTAPPRAGQLSQRSLDLFKKARETDMQFEMADDQSVMGAHRVIVAARCDWFRRALQSGMREAIDRKITIHDASSFIFGAFLEYLYCGRLNEAQLSVEQLVELLLLSDRYEVDDLKVSCEMALRRSVDCDSALYFFNMADQYNAQLLKSFCLTFIGQHNELTESDVFFDLPIALQAEIFDCVWTQPPPKKSSTLEKLLPPSSPDLPVLNGDILTLDYNCESALSNLESDEEKLQNCIRQLQEIIGDDASSEQLIHVARAADYDLCRAVNFYYALNTNEGEEE